ncbi:hypothetical protein N836_04775 [Leptolyngbya sp. Heron Island J]|uniref:hypothetical protein n=1 Tax=Leptolyngbya sp. Heron Island J TaxID=1385935 RepID=UPI0003B9A193|nr:hypothetical protein [Leptolyngbya sp. Heron Island J]ESA36876.1 hypothetical protein N836_04775 [Leptolyngbya sp. Heron Island J]
MSDLQPLFSVTFPTGGYNPEISINGQTLDKEKASFDIEFEQGNPNYAHIAINDRKIYGDIVNHPIYRILLGIRSLTFNSPPGLNFEFESFRFYRFSLMPHKARGKFKLKFEFHLDMLEHNSIFLSAREFLNKFTILIGDNAFISKHLQNIDLDSDEDALKEAIYTVTTKWRNDSEKPLRYIVDSYLEIFKRAYKLILEEQKSSLNHDSLTEKFNFPPEVKTACEQYLLYFSEFLKDIGIEVTASITEEVENVILAVEPKNKEEALENISQLLQLYLQLPTSSVVNSYQPASELSFPAQKLQAQVLQLQSQLALANAEKQYLNATIQQQSNLIAQQAQTIQSQQFTAQVLVDSLQKQEDDEEELVGKIIRIKDYEAGPVSIGLPELLRRLKALFGSS